MSSLPDLFAPGRERRPAEGAATGPARNASASLDELFGHEAPGVHDAPEPQVELTRRSLSSLGLTPLAQEQVRVSASDDLIDLKTLVGPRARAMSLPSTGGAEPPARIRRVRNGRDWLSITVAAIAVLVVVVAVIIAAAVISSRSPAEDSMRVLAQDEAVLVNGIQSANARIATLETARAEQLTRGEALAAPIAEISGRSDDAARDAVEAARAAFVAAVQAVEVPETVPNYRRDAVDESSLTSVGAAIDAVQARTEKLAPLQQGVIDAQTTLDTAVDVFDAALAAFIGTIPGYAQVVVDESPDALEEFRVATTEAADAVAAADPATAAGWESWTAYIAAIDALRNDQLRAEEEIAAWIAEQERLEALRQQWTPPPPAEGETDPGAGTGDGTDPGDGSGGTTDPGTGGDPPQPAPPPGG